MISKQEILRVANETGLTPHVVEKDYVLGWLLAAVDAQPALSTTWVFKGGTCLKKCHFETYRFSEDLDFTLLDETHLDETFLKREFASIADWIYEEAGIQIPIDRLVFDIYENPRGHLSCEGRVYYQSYFVSGKKSYPKIKFDLTADEKLVLPPSRLTVYHAYSDLPDDGIYISSYSYPEVFGEKVRALGERGRPRDLYDVINLFRNDHDTAPSVIMDVLAQKCTYKGISIPAIADMDAYKSAMLSNWEPMLAHQLPALPELDAYWDALPDFFNWLEGESAQARAQLDSISKSGTIYRPLYGQLGLSSQSGGSLEIIRFAAANRLCVELDYTDQKGERSKRIIEPYSLRKAGTGNILLYAVRAEDSGIRAYIIDQINDASITKIVFKPRYEVELSPTENPPIKSAVGSASQLGIPRYAQARTTNRSSFGNRLSYIYRCPMCNKTFKRKKQNSKLNPHKTTDGWPCSGRTGYLENSIY